MAPETFGQMLGHHRTAAGLSQTVLAAMADYHQTYVGQLERGVKEPSRSAVLAFARVFDLNVSQTDRLLHAAGLSTQLDYRALYEIAYAPVETLKWCPYGQHYRDPRRHFSDDASAPDGLCTYCKACTSARGKAYRTRAALRGQARRAS